ncbi:MAG TPA: hypothetical protein VKR38_11330 [Usitatibacter sp.]|nr:hypothetical protein [Usitatibacter sp.]
MKAFGIILAFVLLVCGGFFLSARQSTKRIHAFCDTVTTSTKISDLQVLAGQQGVKLEGPVESFGPQGKFVSASASNPFMMGEYACRIRGATMTGYVTSKRLGTQ